MKNPRMIPLMSLASADWAVLEEEGRREEFQVPRTASGGMEATGCCHRGTDQSESRRTFRDIQDDARPQGDNFL
jgi:hypothetical protein